MKAGSNRVRHVATAVVSIFLLPQVVLQILPQLEPQLFAQVSALEQVQKLTAVDAFGADTFGASVAISGARAIIGAPLDSVHGSSSGSAYVFRDMGDGVWKQASKLVPSDGNAGDVFGDSVSISGQMAIIGSNSDDRGMDSGSAYIFQENGQGRWDEVAKLIGNDTAAIDYFGRSVAISGGTAIIGAHLDDDRGSDSGSAYIFQDDGSGNWLQTAKLHANDGRSGDFFGIQVAIDGDTAVVGANFDDEGGNDTGAAFVFRSDPEGDWRQVAKLTASDAGTFDWFGSSVAISGRTAIIGAGGNGDAGDRSGAAYIFQEDPTGAWDEIAKLAASDAAGFDEFYKVGISGHQAIVGAFRNDDRGTDSGSAYIFAEDGNGNWEEVSKLTAADGSAEDFFGWSVGISGNTALIGAYREDSRGISAGAAYVFGATPVVPEPSSLALVLVGTAGVGLFPAVRKAASRPRAAAPA